MGLTFRTLTESPPGDTLAALFRLRATVLRDWPFLYAGDPAGGEDPLSRYRSAPGAILVAALDAGRMVGCATGMPLACHPDVREVPLDDLGLAVEDVFYCAESLLLADYRGQGAGHVFFDRREAHARALGFTTALFCAVERSSDHAARPQPLRSYAPFWEARGYRPAAAWLSMTWTDIGEESPSEKRLQVWTKTL